MAKMTIKRHAKIPQIRKKFIDVNGIYLPPLALPKGGAKG